MPGKPNIVTSIAESVRERSRKMAAEIAESIGRPVDGEEPTSEEVRRLWHMRNPQADPVQVEQLLAAGHHSQALDLVYPWRNKLIGPGTPEQRVAQAEKLSRIANQQPEPVAEEVAPDGDA